MLAFGTEPYFHLISIMTYQTLNRTNLILLKKGYYALNDILVTKRPCRLGVFSVKKRTTAIVLHNLLDDSNFPFNSGLRSE